MCGFLRFHEKESGKTYVAIHKMLNNILGLARKFWEIRAYRIFLKAFDLKKDLKLALMDKV